MFTGMVTVQKSNTNKNSNISYTCYEFIDNNLTHTCYEFRNNNLTYTSNELRRKIVKTLKITYEIQLFSKII